MTEPLRIAPDRGSACVVMERSEMSEIITSVVVRPAAASFARYIEARTPGIESLTAAEIVELTFAFHAEWQGSDERRAEREGARAAKEMEREAKRVEREAAREARLLEERARLEERLAKLQAK